MSEPEAPPQWILATQQSLGSLIKKPRMADKYLAKPPFRFLHDIFIEVQNVSGFGRGLFSQDELDHKKITTKQQKVDFLTKWISCVAYALELNAEGIDVNPSKIVTGSEPERTNGFLVRVHEAATKATTRSDDAVERVKSGGVLLLSSKPGARSSVKQPTITQQPKSGSLAPEDGTDLKKETESRRHRDDETQQRQAEIERERRQREEEDAERRRVEEEAERTRQAQEEARRKAEEAEQRDAEERERLERARVEQAKLEAEEREAERKHKTQRRDPLQSSAEQQDINLAESENEEALPLEAMMTAVHERPRTASRRPPQIKSSAPEREAVAEREDVMLPPPNVIEDGEVDADEDDEVHLDASLRPASTGHIAKTAEARPEDHGKLVRDILEVQAGQGAPADNIDSNEAGAKNDIRMGKLRRKRSEVQTEAPTAVRGVANTQWDERPQSSGVDKTPILQDLIQKICGACTPLGKSMELIHQDIALMDRDLEAAREEYKEARALLQEEQKRTQNVLNPILREIQEVQDRINEENDLIARSGVRVTELEKVNE
ncbi:TRAF3-interacting protein 1 [Perkinsus olseni]|uniref:TRAF3-interacting protein 1 n=1 Tax=Perkinsus olseni TaxID=32597 RepID=A0A7J6UPG8_PEROL|nr:TRAF3-interacting protein 1 [Perkinsus olseni]